MAESLELYALKPVAITHKLNLPDAPEATLTTASLAGLRNIDNRDIDPVLREEVPDCGFPHKPMHFFPNMGGDAVIMGSKGAFYIYDIGDAPEGPSSQTHDRLRLPGLPDEPDILLGAHSVAFCYAERQIAVILYRQMCAGEDWNNAFEAISFEDGVTFVDPAVMPPGESIETYMTAERAEGIGIDWLTEKRRKNWAVYPMPEQFKPSDASLAQCRADMAETGAGVP